MNNKGQSGVLIGFLVSVSIILVIAAFAVGPIYNVWASEQNGKAELAQATYFRIIFS
mgnify:CR=1 FL=1